MSPDLDAVLDSLGHKISEALGRGAHAEAVTLAKQVLTLTRQALGPHHFRTLRSMSTLAAFLSLAGRHGEAKALFEEALEGCRAALGLQHPDTLNVMNNFAVLYKDQGRQGGAEALLAEALEARRAALGPHDPETLASMNNLAHLYRDEGRDAEAEPLFREALEGRRAALEPGHPDTLDVMTSLALLYRDQGRYDEAEPLLTEALEGRRATLGSRHPHTLTSMNALAVLCQEQGRHGEAEALQEEVLEGRLVAFGPRHPETLRSKANLASLYLAQGRHREAEALEEEALEGRRAALGPRHRDTLTSINTLALVYTAQNRSGEAEPLLSEALEGRRAALGPRHRDTLMVMHNLALLYEAQGRYGEAEPLLTEALEGYRATLGPGHPNTLLSMNSLAVLYEAQGRHGEAEALFREALERQRAALGPRHPNTLQSMNNLALLLYQAQNRHGEAEPLLAEALEGYRATLGPGHPTTLAIMANLASLYHNQKRYGEAEPLLIEALEGKRAALGPGHPGTLTVINSIALLYLGQSRHGEVEPLLREALEGVRAALGPRHPNTLQSMNNLAVLYKDQGRYGEGEALLREALEEAQAALGPAHPLTLGIQQSRAWNFAAQDRIADALEQLQEMQPYILNRLGTELYTTQAPSARQHIVRSQGDYQDAALSLALVPGATSAAAEVAATAVLRLKGLQAEEEAFLAQIAGRDPDARVIAAEVAELRGRLANLCHAAHDSGQRSGSADGQWAEIAMVTAQLQEREFALGRVSRDYAQHLQVRNFDVAGVQAVLAGLPQRAALLEFRMFRRTDFRTGEFGPVRPVHWGGLLLEAERGLRVVDLGPIEGTYTPRDLYDRLLGPLAAELAGLERLYLAPDGDLYLVPFAALLGPDGRRLTERLDLRLLQTGRDLLRPAPDRLATGLLALGGIDFDADMPTSSATDLKGRPASTGLGQLQRRTETFLGHGFPPLPGTAEEVQAVAALYRAARPREPVEVWEGAQASEARLKALSRPPRVLHLATHGFYRPAATPQDRPLLLSGVALAGANHALREVGRDGILHAIEVQDLDLNGTELVVLSACETAQGQVDYGEGVSGLVRALRTAGARHVMVTLRPVSDEGAADFVQYFYRHWLGQAESDPPAAFRAAQLEAMRAPPDSPAHRDQTWAHFVLVGEIYGPDPALESRYETELAGIEAERLVAVLEAVRVATPVLLEQGLPDGKVDHRTPALIRELHAAFLAAAESAQTSFPWEQLRLLSLALQRHAGALVAALNLTLLAVRVAEGRRAADDIRSTLVQDEGKLRQIVLLQGQISDAATRGDFRGQQEAIEQIIPLLENSSLRSSYRGQLEHAKLQRLLAALKAAGSAVPVMLERGLQGGRLDDAAPPLVRELHDAFVAASNAAQTSAPWQELRLLCLALQREATAIPAAWNLMLLALRTAEGNRAANDILSALVEDERTLRMLLLRRDVQDTAAGDWCRRRELIEQVIPLLKGDTLTLYRNELQELERQRLLAALEAVGAAPPAMVEHGLPDGTLSRAAHPLVRELHEAFLATVGTAQTSCPWRELRRLCLALESNAASVPGALNLVLLGLRLARGKSAADAIRDALIQDERRLKVVVLERQIQEAGAQRELYRRRELIKQILPLLEEGRLKSIYEDELDNPDLPRLRAVLEAVHAAPPVMLERGLPDGRLHRRTPPLIRELHDAFVAAARGATTGLTWKRVRDLSLALGRDPSGARAALGLTLLALRLTTGKSAADTIRRVLVQDERRLRSMLPAPPPSRTGFSKIGPRWIVLAGLALSVTVGAGIVLGSFGHQILVSQPDTRPAIPQAAPPTSGPVQALRPAVPVPPNPAPDTRMETKPPPGTMQAPRPAVPAAANSVPDADRTETKPLPGSTVLSRAEVRWCQYRKVEAEAASKWLGKMRESQHDVGRLEAATIAFNNHYMAPLTSVCAFRPITDADWDQIAAEIQAIRRALESRGQQAMEEAYGSGPLRPRGKFDEQGWTRRR